MRGDDIRDLVKAKKEQISSSKSSLNDYLRSSLEIILKDCVKKTLEGNELKFVIFTHDYTLVKGIDSRGYAMNDEIFIYNKDGKLSPNRMKQSYSESTGDNTLSIDNFDPNKIPSILSNLVSESGGEMKRMKGYINEYGQFVYYQPHRDYCNYVDYLKKAPEGWASEIKKTHPKPYTPRAFQLISLDLCHQHQTRVIQMYNTNQNNHDWEDDDTPSYESGEQMQAIRFEPSQSYKPDMYFTQSKFTLSSSHGAPRVHFIDIFFIDYS